MFLWVPIAFVIFVLAPIWLYYCRKLALYVLPKLAKKFRFNPDSRKSRLLLVPLLSAFFSTSLVWDELIAMPYYYKLCDQYAGLKVYDSNTKGRKVRSDGIYEKKYFGTFEMSIHHLAYFDVNTNKLVVDAVSVGANGGILAFLLKDIINRGYKWSILPMGCNVHDDVGQKLNMTGMCDIDVDHNCQ